MIISYIKDKWFTMLILIIILSGGPALYNLMFFSFAPESWIVENGPIIAEDIDVNASYQSIQFTTIIHHPHDALVVRELNLINQNSREVVYKTKVNVFAGETEEEEVVIVRYDIPEGILEVGEYYWEIGITRRFSYGVIRHSDLQTNIFRVNNATS